MTHSKQAAKRVRTNEKARFRNRAVRSGLKSALKSALSAAPDKRDAAARLAIQRADKAAKQGVIHKNTAARRKSRLQKALNKLAAAPK
jgi:small subunit ribosomal protein S20